MEKVPSRRVIVLGTADWNQPIATNQHYATREIAREFDVTFVESLGLRRPELRIRDLKRIMSRLKPAGERGSSRDLPPGVRVLSPKVVPVHAGPTALLNRLLLKRQFPFWAGRDQPTVLWTYSPITYGLNEVSDRTVYHCVDLLANVPGIDAGAIERGERNLASMGAAAVASSAVVASHLESVGFEDVRLWENVADVDQFRLAVRAPERAGAVFAGNLHRNKVDFRLLEAVLEAGIDLHLAGPVAEGGGDARAEVERLIELGAHHHGMLSPSELGRLFARCSVGLIPYLRNSYTEGVSPLKTFEYLAAGLAVVSTGIPGVTAVSGDTYVEHSPIGFVSRATELSGKPSAEEVARRVDHAEQHSWSRRGAQMRDLVRAAFEGIDLEERRTS